MKSAGSTLKTYLTAAQASSDVRLIYAECYTFTLSNGTVLRYTSADVPIIYGGSTFSASGPIIQGFKFHSTIGLNVDQQELDLWSWPTYSDSGVALSPAPPTVGGMPFMAAIKVGLFDGCAVQRDRVFFSDRIGGTIIGGVTLFSGGVMMIEECGRLTAKLTVGSELRRLSVQMPRNTYSATCNHSLYDAGCGIVPFSVAGSGITLAGCTTKVLLTAGADVKFIGGYLTWLDGPFVGRTFGIKNAITGTSFTLTTPMPAAPGTDSYQSYPGCDHTAATCLGRFNNLQNFRGFPFVPEPQSAQ